MLVELRGVSVDISQLVTENKQTTTFLTPSNHTNYDIDGVGSG